MTRVRFVWQNASNEKIAPKKNISLVLFEAAAAREKKRKRQKGFLYMATAVQNSNISVCLACFESILEARLLNPFLMADFMLLSAGTAGPQVSMVPETDQHRPRLTK